MKTKITEKRIKEMYKNIIIGSYCELQYLLSYKNPNYYTSGVYGWNADIYIINYDTVIVTGYRPFGNIRNHDINKKYNEKAKNILRTTNHEIFINELLESYINELL